MVIKDNVNFLEKREQLSEAIHKLQMLVALESERGPDFENYYIFKSVLNEAQNLIDEMGD